jgi:hypothetical protein
MTNISLTNSRETCFATGDQKIISVRFKNPARSIFAAIPNNVWKQAETLPATWKAIIDRALEDSAESILREYLKAFSVIPSEIPSALFASSAIIEGATNGNQQWLSKEELETAWKNSATRKAFYSSANYSTNQAYRKAVARYEELILKLSGKSSQFDAKELDLILAKMNDADFATDLGTFVTRRIEALKNKPEKSAIDFDLL